MRTNYYKYKLLWLLFSLKLTFEMQNYLLNCMALQRRHAHYTKYNTK